MANTSSLCHVLLFYRKMIPSILLCGQSQMEALAKAGKAEFRSVLTQNLTNEDLNWADVVILGRTDTRTELQIAKKLKEAGKYLIYMIDDDLLNISGTVSSAAHYHQKETVTCIRSAIALSDAVMSPSRFLLERYAPGKTAMWMEETALHPVRPVFHGDEAPVVIGFAGSIDRVADLEAILPEALHRIADRFGSKVRFEFFGAVPSFARELQAVAIPYCDSYGDYIRSLGERHWDIGLAPMPDTDFHRNKHYIKYIEYSSLGIAGIYSDVMPYTQLDEKGWPSIRCENTADAWTEVISGLIQDPDTLRQVREQVNALAVAQFSTRAVAEAFVERNPSLLQWRSGKKVHGMWMPLAHLTLSLDVFMSRVRAYGVRLPVVAAQKVWKKIRRR